MASAPHSTEAPSQEDASTRERILDVALDCFASLGFDGASTRTIATGAGVNQGLIPYYFGTKDALWREAVDLAFARLREGMGELGAEAGHLGDRERLAVLIRRYVHFVAKHPEFVRLMHEEGKRESDRMDWLVERHVRPLYEALTSLFLRADGVGRLPAHMDPLHFYYVYVGAVGALFHQAPECRRLTGRDPSDPAVVEAHADALVQLFLGDTKEDSR